MSGPGDIDGEVSGDEAAWRDLIAHFDDPADTARTEAPWPASENVADSGAEAGRPDAGAPDAGAPDARASDGLTRTSDADTSAAGPPDSTAPGGRSPSAELAGPGERPGPETRAFPPVDRTRLVSHAGDPRSYTPPEEEDEPYVPVPLPPPGRLDSVAKAAWVAVIGGPAYLLIVGLILQSSISAMAAFIAVAAFVGGFVTLVLRLGDHPRRDDDDDGAVL